MSVDRSVVKHAIVDSMPLYVPAIPFALVIGLAVAESGMNPLLGWSTAWIIFGGAAQLTLIALLGSGTAVAAAVTAAIVVNARHLMYSAALAPKFQEQPRWFRWVGPYVLIDQLFALVMLRLDDDPKTWRTYYLTVGAFFWSMWQVTIAIGLFVGPVIPGEWNLAFAVPILFVGLVVMGIDKSPKLVAALAGAGFTFLFAGLPNRGGLLVGAFVGVLAGTFAERVKADA
jgi:predicted branched-subunit amino acid permease